MTTVLKEFATATRRWRAGEDVPDGAIPAPEAAALVEGGYLSAPAPAAPAAPQPIAVED
jgi:hypothetical protein